MNTGRKSEEKLLPPCTKMNWKSLHYSLRKIIIEYLDKDSYANLLELILRNPFYRKIFARSFPSDLDRDVSERARDFGDCICERARRLSKFRAYTLKKQENNFSVVESRLMDMLWKENAALSFCPEFEVFFVWVEEHMKHVLGESINRKKHSLTNYYEDSLTFKLDCKTFIEPQRSFVCLRKEYRGGSVGLLGYYSFQSFQEILLSFSFEGNYFVLSGSEFTEDNYGSEVRLQYRSTSSTHSFVFLYPERKEHFILVRGKKRWYFDKVDTVMMLKTAMIGETQVKLTPAEFEQKATSFEYLTSENFQKITDMMRFKNLSL